MNILLIGGTGNISTECAALLNSRGHTIFVLTRGNTAVSPQYHALRADRKDLNAVRDAVASLQLDVAINFIGFDISDLALDFEVFRQKVRQYIFVSSATVYSKPPLKLPITEDAPLGNRWWDYAQKKLACERWLLDRCKSDGFPVTIVRPSHTYSKLWVPNPISSASYSFAARLEAGKPVFVMDQGENRWTLTATSDFAVGLAGLVGKPEAIGKEFHITSDEVLTWNEIYGEIAAALGVLEPKIEKIPTDFICKIAPQLTGNLKGDKSHPGVFDNTRIKQLVPEYRCLKPFRVGVRESIDWLRKHPEQQKLNPEVDATIEGVIAEWRRQNGK
jgi:nucleoside-diphosphate-sugar epimerase